MKFEIKEDFLIDGQAVKLISGAVHYFRLAPTHWERTLRNLKAMGGNCVETYVPWNLHEPREGEFNFSGFADLPQFIELAQNLGLYVIVRPSCYICAEWDFGGLPAWLLKDGDMRVRSQYPRFMEALENYFKVLLPKLVPYQFTHGGKVLMMQIENEYGSYGQDNEYVRRNGELMKKYGIDVPLFTSDGGWKEALDGGALPEYLATANFGSGADWNFAALEEFNKRHGVKAPLMCMEFWDGWFNNWGDEIVKRSPEDTAEEARKVLKKGSINFYMFQGGTNFGFFNGCSDTGPVNKPQITSYDYDAPITEWGAPTEKFFALQQVIKEEVPEAKISEPIYPAPKSIGTFPVTNEVSLFSVYEDLVAPTKNDTMLPMEKIGQNFGYLLYRTTLAGPRGINELKLRDAQDRAQIFMNQKWMATQYQESLGQGVCLKLEEETNELVILVENTGRNNYGPKVVAETQRKGIRGGVTEDNRFIPHWEHYSLELEEDMIAAIDFSKASIPETPTFYQFQFELAEPADTFLDCSDLGKGAVFVNGVNLGRYWDIGPVRSLYIPDYFWKTGHNEVVIFETESKVPQEIRFLDMQKVD